MLRHVLGLNKFFIMKSIKAEIDVPLLLMNNIYVSIFVAREMQYQYLQKGNNELAE